LRKYLEGIASFNGRLVLVLKLDQVIDIGTLGQWSPGSLTKDRGLLAVWNGEKNENA
jgi:hypothetical protein